MLGKSIGPMDAASYFSYKKQLIPTIRQAYDILAEEYDILVLEGAGARQKSNLKQGDIVNMGMAQMAKSPGPAGRGYRSRRGICFAGGYLVPA